MLFLLNLLKKIGKFINDCFKKYPVISVIVALAFVVFLYFKIDNLLNSTSGVIDKNFGHTNPNNLIDKTPEILKSINQMQEWTFLTITGEEIRKASYTQYLIKKRQIVRFYYGKLRFGIDLTELKNKKWLKLHGDTANLKLPEIKLLNKEIIVRDTTFYQNGNWDKSAWDSLRNKAERQFIRRYNTPETISRARKQGENAVAGFFAAFGINVVEIEWKNDLIALKYN